jgi:uncharacterized protein (TIGR02594 family)
MTIVRVVTELDKTDVGRLNFLKALVEADGGKTKLVPEPDGTVALVATFPAATGPDLAMPVLSSVADTWMQIARKEIGQKEAPGDADNVRIREYHATTQGGAVADSVPWCSSFVNFCITQAGLTGTNKKNARSWAKWGKAVADLVPGCVVVLSRGSDPNLGHVGFFVGHDGPMVRLLGGNQSDAVGIASYDADRIVAKRMPA